MISLNGVAFSFKIYFSFSFCSDFNLEVKAVKTDKVRGCTVSLHQSASADSVVLEIENKFLE